MYLPVRHLRNPFRSPFVLVMLTVIVAAILASGFALARVRGVTPQLPSERSGHTATLLDDGRILVVGGERDGAALATTEFVDPANGKTSAGPDIAFARSRHSATLLADGALLIAGGKNAGAVLGEVEIYDPRSNSFAVRGTLAKPRADHTAVRLADGRVLIAGGDDAATAEIFDGREFKLLGSMRSQRFGASAALLPDGRVLIAGGRNASGDVLQTAEIFDPAAGTFTGLPGMKHARVAPMLSVLPDGKVQVIGGDEDGTMEIFDGRHFTAFTVLRVLDPKTIAGTKARFAFTRSDASKLDAAIADAAKPVAREGAVVTFATRTAVITGGASAKPRGVAPTEVIPSSGAWVTTDKSDYHPGQRVTITGGGFAPGEVVVLILERNPETTPATSLTATTDADGAFTNNEYVCAATDANVTFTLTATGQTSGRIALTSFTDFPSSYTVTATQNAVPIYRNSNPAANYTVTYTVTVQGDDFSGVAGSCSGAGVVTITTSGLGAVTSDSPTIPALADDRTCAGSTTLTLTVPDNEAAHPAGSLATFTVTATDSQVPAAVTGSNSATLQIDKRPVTVTGITASNKPYDGTMTASLNVGAAALSGVLGGDVVNLNTGGAAGAFTPNANAANGKTVNITGLTVDNANYTVTQPTTTADITKVSLTVTAADKSKVYDGLTFTGGGGSFTATLSGFVNSETAAVVSGSPGFSGAATTATDVGNHTITPNAGTYAATNYDFPTMVNGTLTISQAPSRITISGSPTGTYGSTAAVTATVERDLAGDGSWAAVPAGTAVSVTVSDGSISYSCAPDPTTDATGTITCNAPLYGAGGDIAVGTYTAAVPGVLVSLPASTNVAGSTATSALTVTRATPTLKVNNNLVTDAVYGGSATLNATLTYTRGGATTNINGASIDIAAGDDTNSVACATQTTVAGAISCSVDTYSGPASPLKAGSWLGAAAAPRGVRASYAQTANFSAATGTGDLAIAKADTTLVITDVTTTYGATAATVNAHLFWAASNPATHGEIGGKSVTLTATDTSTPARSATCTPTSTGSPDNPNVICSAAGGNGLDIWKGAPANALQAGTYNTGMSGSFAGDSNFNGSGTVNAKLTINKADTTLIVTAIDTVYGTTDVSGVTAQLKWAATNPSDHGQISGQSVTITALDDTPLSAACTATSSGGAGNNVLCSAGTGNALNIWAGGPPNALQFGTYNSGVVGQKGVYATFAGDSNFNASSDTDQLRITKYTPAASVDLYGPTGSVAPQEFTFAYNVRHPAAFNTTCSGTSSSGVLCYSVKDPAGSDLPDLTGSAFITFSGNESLGRAYSSGTSNQVMGIAPFNASKGTIGPAWGIDPTAARAVDSSYTAELSFPTTNADGGLTPTQLYLKRNYAAVTRSVTYKINEAGQIVNAFAALSDRTYGDPDFTTSATSSQSGYPLLWTTSNSTICTVTKVVTTAFSPNPVAFNTAVTPEVSYGVVHMKHAGTCRVWAVQDSTVLGDLGTPGQTIQQNFNYQTTWREFTINPLLPYIVWPNPADITYPAKLTGTQLNAKLYFTFQGFGTTTLTREITSGITPAYFPKEDAVLAVGPNQTLSVNYIDSSGGASLTTNGAMPVGAPQPLATDFILPVVHHAFINVKASTAPPPYCGTYHSSSAATPALTTGTTGQAIVAANFRGPAALSASGLPINDLITASTNATNTGKLRYYTGLGDVAGSFSTATSVTPPAIRPLTAADASGAWIALQTGSFYAAGGTDVAAANAADGTISIFKNTLGVFADADTKVVDLRTAAGAYLGLTANAVPRGMAVGNLTGHADGLQDLVVTTFDETTGDSAVVVIKNNSDGTFTPIGPRALPLNYAPWGVGVGNFDPLDGPNTNADVAVANFGTAGTVTVLFGNGDGTFSITKVIEVYTGTPSLIPSPRVLAVGNINADTATPAAVCATCDTYDDIVLGNYGPIYNQGRIYTLKTDGMGNFTVAAPVSVVRPSAIALNDLDGDGDLDILATSYTGNNLSIYMNKGDDDGFIDSANNMRGIRTTALSPMGLAIANFDNESRSDIAIVGASQITRLLLNVASTAGMAAATVPSTGPGAVVTLKVNLTGSGPWTVKYRTSAGATVYSATATASPLQLRVAPTVDTTYTLVSVAGAGSCSGGITVGSEATLVDLP